MHKSEQLSRSSSIETLEEIVKNYQRNEQRLHDLKQYVRHERKKAERLLHEAAQRPKEPVEYFLSFDDNQPKKNHHRVRFTLPDQESKTKNYDDELAELSHRCENLLSTLHFYRPRSTLFSPVPNDSSLTLQQALYFSRPDFISHSQQRTEHIQHLREDRQYHRVRSPSPIINYQQMKKQTKEKYNQLPEVHERQQKDLSDECKRRNYLRAKIFRHRLRQHVLLHGRTDIDESLTMVDT